jgi:alpha-ketoglutaric semialdehyde dehydrogenase
MNPRRRAGSDRHGVPRGRRRATALRLHDSVGAPEQVRMCGPRADRRRRADHALELPDRDPCWKSMPALVCGNTVVIKPASLTPLSVVMLAEVLEEAGLPKGVFNVVTGGGSKVGDPLLHHNGRAVVSFTGSTEVGREISKSPARRLQARSPRDGRQERRSSSWTTRYRPRGRRRGLGRIRNDGPALHRGLACRRSRKVYDEFVEKLAGKAKTLRSATASTRRATWPRGFGQGQLETADYVKIGREEGRDARGGRETS